MASKCETRGSGSVKLTHYQTRATLDFSEICSHFVPMDDFRRRGLPEDIDTLSLRRVIELWIYYDIELVLVCTRCKRRAKVDLIDRIDRFGADSTLGTLRRRSRCIRCSDKVPTPFFVIEGAKRCDAKWFPRPP